MAINAVENPRKEAEDHYYNPAHTGLLNLGLEPNYLTDEVLAQLMSMVMRHREKIKRNTIFRGVKW